MSDHQLDLNQCFVRAPGVLSRDLGDEAVLLDLERGRYFGLNPTGRRIWALLEEEGPLTRVLERLLAEFEGSEEAVEGDLVELVSHLESEGLVRRRS